MIALAIAAAVYAVAAIGSWLSASLGEAMLEASAINEADIDGNRIIAALCAAIAALSAVSLALTVGRSRSRHVRPGDARRPVRLTLAAMLLCAVAQMIFWSLGGPRWVGALVSDDAQVKSNYGNRGWLLIGALVATAACVAFLRRIAIPGTSNH